MRAPASTPRVGSSASSTSGSASSERAKSTFCWLPPESDETGVSTVGVRTPSRSISVGREARLAAPLRRSRARATRRARGATCSRAPRAAGRALDVAVAGQVDDAAALRARPGFAARHFWPRSRTSPCAGSRPASARRNSRWPLPSTPARPTISPGRTSSSTSWKRGPLRPLTRSSGAASAKRGAPWAGTPGRRRGR